MADCQFVELTPNVWHCPNCDLWAYIEGVPRRSGCDGVPTHSHTKRVDTYAQQNTHSQFQPVKYDSEAREKALLEIIPPCEHRGAILRKNVICELCGGKGDLYPVYRCKVFEECSLGKRAEGLHHCLMCPESTTKI